MGGKGMLTTPNTQKGSYYARDSETVDNILKCFNLERIIKTGLHGRVKSAESTKEDLMDKSLEAKCES